jgi:putrescine oxidase
LVGVALATPDFDAQPEDHSPAIAANSESLIYVGRDGRRHRYPGGGLPLDTAGKRAYEEAAARLDALAVTLDPWGPWAHADAPELDALTFEAWLQRQVTEADARDLLRSLLAGGYLTKPAHTFSLLQCLWMIAGAGSVANLVEPDLCLNSRVVGGAQLIPIRLAEELGERVHLGAPVRACSWSQQHVELQGGELTVRARRAVVAIPPNLTPTIAFDPPLPAWRLRLEQALSQGSVIKVLAAYDKPFWRAEGLSGEALSPYLLVRETYDNTPPAGWPGVLVTFLAGENAERADRLTAAERRAAVLDDFARYYGPPALDAIDFVELDWSAEEWTRGAYGTSFGVGGLTRFGPDLRRPVGPLHWACTDISGIGHIHMEGAIRSGQAAARAALAALRREPQDTVASR